MIFIYLWLVSKPLNFLCSISDFVLFLLGTFPHTLEDTALFVRPEYRPREYPGKGEISTYMLFCSTTAGHTSM